MPILELPLSEIHVVRLADSRQCPAQLMAVIVGKMPVSPQVWSTS